MKYKSALMTTASGSVGGLTASHNRGGQYFRARVIPTNPASAFQQTVRAAMAQLANLWITTLTGAQRDAWEAYADAVLLPDKLGEPRNIGGLAMYVRSNVSRIQLGLPRVDSGPVLYDLGDFTAPSIASITAPTALSLTFTDTDDWCDEDDAAMYVAASRGKNPTINYYAGPYRTAGKIDGDSSTPPTSPAAITLPFSVTAGQKVFIQVRVTRADGRLSNYFRAADVAV